MKKLLFTLLFITLIAPGFLLAAPMSGRWAASFTSQIGIQPVDRQALELGATTFGTIVDAAQLSKLGFKGIKAGDKVQITLMEGNKLKISIMAVKQEQIIQLNQ